MSNKLPTEEELRRIGAATTGRAADRFRDMVEKDLARAMRRIMNQRDTDALHDRVAYLRREAEAEEEQEPLQDASLAGLLKYIEEFDATLPSLVLTHEGNLRARWEFPWGIQNIEFLDADYMRVMLRPDEGEMTQETLPIDSKEILIMRVSQRRQQR